MNKDEKIDAQRYPNFAALAHDSTWFRSATTVQWLTEVAVPAVLTGILPKNTGRKLLPIYADHPDNVFTLLGGSYRVRAVESITSLCPPKLCKEVRGASPSAVSDTTRLARVGRGHRLPAPPPAAAVRERHPGDQRQLGELRQARGRREAERGERERADPAVWAKRLPVHLPVLARPQADPVRAALAAAARAVSLSPVGPAVRGAGAVAARDPAQPLAAGLARAAGRPALPAPGRVHRPRSRIDHAAPQGEGDLRPRARDRRRRPRRQQPARPAAPPADTREPPGHRVRAAVREAPGPARRAGSTTALRGRSTSSRRSRTCSA